MLVIPARVKVVVVMVSALALAAGLLTLTLLAKPAQAQAQTVTDRDRTPFSFIVSGCDEPFLLEGAFYSVAHTTTDANGGFHTWFQFKLQGTGEGLSSGDRYVYQNVFNEQLNFTGPINHTFTQTFKRLV
jgi:hypothetical protein